MCLCRYGVTVHNLAEAETIHDILVREARRDRIRARGEGEDMLEVRIVQSEALLEAERI